MRWEEIPYTEYEELATQFNPVKFDGDEWADLAEKTGMKYMVITAKHHDGFAMCDSKASTFDIIDTTSFEPDPMKELSEACDNDVAGSPLHLSSRRDERIETKENSDIHGMIKGTGGSFKRFDLGEMEIFSPNGAILFGLKDDFRAALVHVRKIILTPIP